MKSDTGEAVLSGLALLMLIGSVLLILVGIAVASWPLYVRFLVGGVASMIISTIFIKVMDA